MKINKAIFLDRDGVICENRDDYVKSWDEFVFLPQAKQAIKKMNGLNYKVIIITNQSCINRGIISEDKFWEINNSMIKDLKKLRAKIDAIYFCPHLPQDDCNCRKPKIGNILKAQKELNIDLKKSFFIGDSISDIRTGKSANCKTILVLTGKGKQELKSIDKKINPDFIVEDLNQAVDLIKNLSDKSGV